MMRGLRAVGCVTTAVATAVVVVGGGAFADPGSGWSHVDEVSAVVDADGVAVTGQASFVDTPEIVGVDAFSDAVGTRISPLGHELAQAMMSRPEPFGDTLRFTLVVDNLPPAVNGVPEFVVYRWEFTVTTAGQEHSFMLNAWRTNQWLNPGSVEPYFLLGSCEPNPSTGVADCTELATLPGTMAGRVVTWDVPMEEISAEPGSVISSDDGIAAVFSLSGALSGGVVYDEIAEYFPYTVPGPRVRMGIAPAGTAAQDIPLTANGAVVDATGAFHGRLPSPATPGEYTVAVQACHGADWTCGVAITTNVTVP